MNSEQSSRPSWNQLNWFGRFLVHFHNVLLGPEYGFNDNEMRMIKRWGIKR